MGGQRRLHVTHEDTLLSESGHYAAIQRNTARSCFGIRLALLTANWHSLDWLEDRILS